MTDEKKIGNKTTLPIAIAMVAGLALGFVGLIKMDADTVKASNFWMIMMIVGFASFGLGFLFLNIIQPRNK
jgi:formate/nitrite transporter FocA (FNT family)